MNDRQKKEQLYLLLREKKIRQSRKSFWQFCKTLAPDFYKDSRSHLKTLCNTLQDLFEGKLYDINGEVIRQLMINMPPRLGKTRTLIMFSMWVFGIRVDKKIFTCSYSHQLAIDFSRYTRNAISEIKNKPTQIVYSDIFPDTKITRGDASLERWSLDGQFFSYLATGMGGTITGKGADIIIVDDPVKNAYEAFNEKRLQDIEDWYTGTLLSREEGKNDESIKIINMTRWSKKDLCGRRLIDADGNPKPDAHRWHILQFEAMYEEGEMLCPEILSYNKYCDLRNNMTPEIFKANYHQQPVDVEGKLYTYLQTYKELPEQFERILAYADTADQGDDYLCCVVAGEYKNELYILDVYYTKEGMEITEPKTAEMLHNNAVNYCKIEYNNGGGGFMRNVKKLLWQNFNNGNVQIIGFHQRNNKIARILSNATFIMQHVYFPSDWRLRWAQFAGAMTQYQREGTNEHDDAPDAVTGLVEIINKLQPTIYRIDNK